VEWSDERRLNRRAQAASLMMPWPDIAKHCAERLGIDYQDVAEQSDDVLIGVLADVGFTREAMAAAFPLANAVPPEQLSALMDSLGIEKWFAENIRRAVREEDPLPFGLGVGGSFIVAPPDEATPMVWAVATPMSDPDAVAKQFLRNCRKALGKQAFKDVSQHAPRTHEHRFTPEQMVAMHERGMSYKEIAIQSLRDEHPEIVTDPDKFEREWRREKGRIIKVISAAKALWKERAPETSID
jgi:hypothetical protein